MQFLKGMKVIHRAQPGWGVGHVLAVSEDPPRLSAQFPGRPGGPVILSTRDAQIARWRFPNNCPAQLGDGSPAKVLRQLPGPSADLHRYTVEAPGKKPTIRSEADLRATAPREGPAEQLASGRWGNPQDFRLRSEVVRLDLERRADALGALFASRVYVKPHQVSVAHQVLSAQSPRFVLADEVGLGKTIEAGLVLSALLHAGLVKRCLVVAPSHLTVQWLAELFHKFNLLFTLMDPDRAKEAREEAPATDDLGAAVLAALREIPAVEGAEEEEAPELGDLDAEEESEAQGTAGSMEDELAANASPWARHPLVITSLEWLSRAKEEAAEAAQAGWDLVVIDEAHHLRGERAYEVASALAKRSWGLLLLTATPLQLDPAEYHALLRLVDPAPAATEAELLARLKRQGDLSTEVRALLSGDPQAAGRIAALFPEDKELHSLGKGKDERALLAHLAEGYGLSSRLLRNRRAVVGGFTPRTLRKVEVELSPAERKLEDDVRAALAQANAKGKLPAGAVLGSLLRRLGSSPPALAAGLSGTNDAALKALASRAAALGADGSDSKLEAFRDLLSGELASEKVLVFAEARETIDYLRLALARPGTGKDGQKRHSIEALAYLGDLSPAERDKLVARFRDPEGPRVLLSTELGGEGRNFQHCHVLVNYDLSWSPAAIEQRIGRIDRIGQSREVILYAFHPEGTLAARVLDVLDAGVGVFTEPVGGLDAVLEQVESELVSLGVKPGSGEGKAWEEATRELKQRVSAARAEVGRAHDPLLDRRSCDVDAVRALAERGAQRVGVSLGLMAKKGKGAAAARAAARIADRAADAAAARAADPTARPGDLAARSGDLAARSGDLAASAEPTAEPRPADELAVQLSAVAAALERRLESVTIEVAKRVGLAVDVEVDVLPGEVSFQVGPELKVDALAGFDLSQDRVVLGSFRREIAVAHEEHDSFATGHPLIEALFGWVRDGELGRGTVYRARVRGASGAALDARWLVALPEPADLAQGARVPSRRASRHLEESLVRVVVSLDGRGGVAVEEGLAAQLDSAQPEAVPAPEGGPPAPFVAAVESGLRAAEAEAKLRLTRIVAAAKEHIREERWAAHKRLTRFLSQSRVPEKERERVLAAEARLYDQASAALDGARLELDQASLIQLL